MCLLRQDRMYLSNMDEPKRVELKKTKRLTWSEWASGGELLNVFSKTKDMLRPWWKHKKGGDVESGVCLFNTIVYPMGW